MDDLTFDQIDSLWRHGEAPDDGLSVESVEDIERIAKNWRQLAGV